jgi:hypothetical protein
MLNFREWFYFNESIEANIDIWISGVIDPKRPDGTPIPLPDNEAELNNFQVNQQQKQLMVDNLNKFDLSNPVDSGKRKLKITANHVKFLLGFIKSKPQALTEDYERALDALFWAFSSNRVTKQVFGTDSYNIGKNIQRYIEEKDREEGPSKREEEREKKEGKAHDIDPLHQEGNIKCYYLPKIKSDLSEDEKKKAISERHKLLCKYGKNTGWCTASPSGTYHEIYKYDEIYIIHDDSIPVYQFVHCTKTVKSKNCQFMDINDKMPNDDEFIKMKPSVYKFIKKYFPKVFEFYRLEQYGLDDIGKMVMDLENNPENEGTILQGLEEKKGDFSHIAQFYVDKNLPIPDIFQEFILRNYKNILTDHDWKPKRFVNFIVDNINNPLSQKILNSELDDVNIQHLLKNSNNTKEMAKVLGSENMNKLTDDDIYYLLKDAKKLREMATLLGVETINKLNYSNIFLLLKDAKNLREMVMILGKENINKLGMIGSYYVFHLLKDAKNVREMGMILGKENINKLNDEDFLDLISYSIEKDTEGLLEIMGAEIINKISLGALISIKKSIQDNYVNKNITSEKNYNNREKILNILDQIIKPKWDDAHSKYYPSLKS